MMFKRPWSVVLLAVLTIVASAPFLFGQADQGTITGVVQDPTGAVIGNANVTLTSTDTGQILKSKADGGGVYVFSPVKIGNYSVTAAAPGFETTTQTNLHLSIQQRLNVVVVLKPGATSETVTVTTEAPLMQTQESSVGQVMDTDTINNVPLNGRNWVYIAQLSAGTAVAEGSRGGGKGDFEANGQRAEENNFILDGVDNNVNVVDFYNGASYVAQPPPDALAEFKVQTSDYSAEFGHSAGAVVNASLKSGTNSLHGSLWEYVRNTAFDTHDWTAAPGTPVPAYHENQFGATLGGPFLKNKLFFFGDAQANRITFQESSYTTVPSLKERVGDFSELLDPTLTKTGASYQLFNQTANAAPVAFANNCLVTSSSCTNTLGATPYSAAALALLAAYPAPNAGGGVLYNNYYSLRPVLDNTFQWDARMDWNIGSKDSTYSRYSYWNEVGHNEPPFGNIVDGGGFGDDGKQKNYGANFMWSETHVFTPTLTNEVRFGFNYLHTGFQHPNAANLDFASSVGFGGIPQAKLNGGLPRIIFNNDNGVDQAGSPEWSTTDEHENVYQILDNVTKIWGSHALKAGVSFQNIRFSTLQPQFSRGEYNYNGHGTANLSGGTPVVHTGNSVADFVLDLQTDHGGLSNETTNGDQRSDNAAYFQDDWRINPKLTLNLGVRWEFFQPYQDVGGYQASFNMTGPMHFDPATGTGSGTAQYLIPKESLQYAMGIINSPSYSPNYGQILAKDNITIVPTSDPHLLKAQKNNFAPRVGVAWSPSSNMVVRAGYGIFYGGLESLGYWPNLGENYPFQFTGTFPAPSCNAFQCPTDGITVGNGFSSIIAAGFASNVTGLTMRGSDPSPKTPYTQDYNLAIERSFLGNMVATASYVGNNSRHMPVNVDANAPLALAANGLSSQPFRPLPDAGGSAYVSYSAISAYNGLQTKLEKRMSHGWNMLATYTWSHARDDGNTPLGSSGDNGQQNYNLIPLKNDFSQSPFDTRHRFTFNGLYQLPFGKGRAYMNNSRLADLAVGGWSANATFVAQTGNYFTVYPAAFNTPSGGSSRAVKIGDPFKTGGTSSVAGVTCPTSVRNKNHWFNPCSFTNPWDASDPAGGHYLSTGPSDPNVPKATPDYVTDTATALGYLGGRRNTVAGPGYERVNMSIFKEFKTYREQNLEFRADIFNLFNTPSLAEPSDGNIDKNAGEITGTRNLQRYAPDSRFFQLSLRYEF